LFFAILADSAKAHELSGFKGVHQKCATSMIKITTSTSKALALSICEEKNHMPVSKVGILLYSSLRLTSAIALCCV
jgi:hypothetical protein